MPIQQSKWPPELIRTFGAQLIKSERPITAGLLGDTWIVSGSLHCNGKGGRTTICLGGVASPPVEGRRARAQNLSHDVTARIVGEISPISKPLTLLQNLHVFLQDLEHPESAVDLRFAR
jgi:hypothetical protein